MINPKHVTWILNEFNVKCKVSDVKYSEKWKTLILYRLKPNIYSSTFTKHLKHVRCFGKN